jgi:hypothetical protein
MISTAYILPLLGVAAVGPALNPVGVRRIMTTAAAFIVIALAVSPIVAYATVALRVEDRQQVSRDIAWTATSVWHAQLQTSMRVATGTEPFSLALPFYSPDGPAEFTHFNSREAPWITPARIAREGILCICETTDTVCLEQAEHYATPETKRIARTFRKEFWGLRGRAIEVVMIVVPPASR